MQKNEDLQKVGSEKVRQRTGKMDIAVIIIGVAMAGYHMAFSQYLIHGPVEHTNVHLGFSLILAFLGIFQTSTQRYKRYLLLFAALLSLFATGYVAVFHEELEGRVWFNTPLDLVVGAILIFLVVEATRQSFGLAVPLVAVLAVVYPFFGRYLPEPFTVASLPLAKTISNLSIGLTGIYGPVLSASADYIFLFILFGAILYASEVTGFLLEISKVVGSKLRGGPALMAVVSSSLVGMVIGSPVANVAIVGSFTIPLMKKLGYTADQAGAIEAASSNGGQIMPPVMGIAAFAMAGLTGIPYVEIIKMAILPALLYYLCCWSYVQLRAEKSKIPLMGMKVDVREILLSCHLFVVPFTVITILFIKGYSVMFTAFWGIIVAICVSLIRKKTRPSLATLLRGVAQGAKTGAQIGVMCASMGLVVTTFQTSGLGIKLSAGIEAWSGGYLFPALLITWLICIMLGCVGVTAAAYIVASIFAVPVLMKMGIGLAQAHFFIMFVTVFGFLTPPIGVTALVASRLAQGDYIKTSFQSCIVAAAGFLLPFIFIYNPALLLLPQESHTITAIIASAGFMVFFQAAVVGYFLTDLTTIERALLLVANLSLLIYLVVHNYAFFAAGMGLFALLFLRQLRKRRSANTSFLQSAG